MDSEVSEKTPKCFWLQWLYVWLVLRVTVCFVVCSDADSQLFAVDGVTVSSVQIHF